MTSLYGFRIPWSTWVVAALVLGLSVGPLGAQDSEGDPPEDEQEEEITTELVFEREVFNYPVNDRDPFQPLTDDPGTGPRFEDLALLGVISGNSAESSVALVSVGGSGQAERLRIGDTVGNVRVVDMGEREIVVEVEEFGAIQERTLRVQRGGLGGGAAAGAADDDDDADDGDGNDDADGDGDDDGGDDGDGNAGDSGHLDDDPASWEEEDQPGANGAGGSR